MHIVIVSIIVFLSVVTVDTQDTIIAEIREEVRTHRGVMQISIETETDSFTLKVKPSDTIKTVKTKIQYKEGIPVNEQSLFFDNDKLYDAYNLSDYGIEEGSIITLVRED